MNKVSCSCFLVFSFKNSRFLTFRLLRPFPSFSSSFRRHSSSVYVISQAHQCLWHQFVLQQICFTISFFPWLPIIKSFYLARMISFYLAPSNISLSAPSNYPINYFLYSNLLPRHWPFNALLIPAFLANPVLRSLFPQALTVSLFFLLLYVSKYQTGRVVTLLFSFLFGDVSAYLLIAKSF